MPFLSRAWHPATPPFFTAASLSVLRGAGHFTPVERPAEFAAAVAACAALPA
ncbi:MAG TPA: hypothetical protein VI365_20040 [Trebonia sp.]